MAGVLAAPSASWALGLGRLTVDSALGQPLSARIELTSATRDELETLTAKIADPSLYRQNNLTYQGVLSRTRVVLDNAGGTPILRITSPTPVNEPFLDLMVELNWAAGRVVREYTFLLDPPGSAAPAVAEPVTPPRTGAARATPAPAPAVAAPSAPTAAPSPRPPSVAAAPSAGGNQYTVKRGDTLAGIAGQYKPEGATLEQMLAALFKGNSGAFDDNNMNRLRQGAILQIPSPADATATNAADATRMVRVQATDWRNYRNRVAANVPASEGGGTRTAGGRIAGTVTEATPAAPPGRDQLKVSPSTGSSRAAEELAAAQLREREKDAKIATLEKTLRDLQDQLKKGQLPSVPPTTTADASKAAPATPPAAQAPGAAPTATPPVAIPVPAPAPAEPSKAAEPAKAPEAAPAPPKVETKAPPPAPKAAPKPPPGFFEDLFANTPLWAIGAGAAAILAGLAALIAARRRKATKFEDSIISGTDIKTNTVFGSTGGGVVNTGENSLASDFSREGLGNIDTDEVDPIAEAEVYLAYGRDAQAEEILKDALKKDPQRQEIYLKLLEIHAQHNKPSAFETVATELFAVSQGQGDVWPKAVALGRQLDPNNPMFAEGGAPAAAGIARAPEAPSPAAAVRKSEPPLDRMIDDDITIAPGMKPAQGAAAPPKAPEPSVRDKIESSAASFKSSLGDVAGAATVAVAGAMAAGKSEIDTLAGKMGDKAENVAEKAKHSLDFHLDPHEKPAPLKAVDESFTLSDTTTGPTPSQLARPAAALELDKLDLSFDPDKATFEDPTPSVLDGQWHDAATKLDLAKAYQEMGDVEGAREILQEVLHEGDDQQKTEAQALLAKLG
jgi:pilus assembly protein FimV